MHKIDRLHNSMYKIIFMQNGPIYSFLRPTGKKFFDLKNLLSAILRNRNFSVLRCYVLLVLRLYRIG